MTAAPGVGPAVLGTGLVRATRAGEEVDGLDAAVAGLGLRGVRPLARAARLACVAAAEALASLPSQQARERVAIVVGTRFASLEPLVEFDRRAAVDGPGLVSPQAFPNVVVNAHAGYLGILFGLSGPNVTLCGAAAGAEAIEAAGDLLELRRADAVLAGGVEALGPTLVEGLRRAGEPVPAEAAAFLLLARTGGPPLPWPLPGEDGLHGAASGAVQAVAAARRASR